LRPVRTPAIRATFAKRFRGPAFDARVAEMCELKSLDRNMSPDEIKNMNRLRKKSLRRAR
jgi:hypothetical protein